MHCKCLDCRLYLLLEAVLLASLGVLEAELASGSILQVYMPI